MNKAIENARAKGLIDDSITVVKGRATQASDDEQEQTIRHLEAQVQEYHDRWLDGMVNFSYKNLVDSIFYDLYDISK